MLCYKPTIMEWQMHAKHTKYSGLLQSLNKLSTDLPFISSDYNERCHLINVLREGLIYYPLIPDCKPPP